MGVLALPLASLLVTALPATAAEAPLRLTATRAGVRWQGAALSGRPEVRGSLVSRWWAAARDTGLASTAVLVPLADSFAARGDTLRADSLLALPRLAHSLWVRDAVRRRATYRAARGDTLGAARILDDPLLGERVTVEDYAIASRLSVFRLALRDTAAAESLASIAVSVAFFDSVAGLEALGVLQRIEAGRPPGVRPRFERSAATVEIATGRSARAAQRIFRIAPLESEVERRALHLWAIHALRDGGMPRASLLACDTAAKWAKGDAQRAAIEYQRALALRDLGQVDSALALFLHLGEKAEDTQRRMLAYWEAACEAQDRSRWRDAAVWFGRAHELSQDLRDGATPGVEAAPFLAGLMHWLAGDTALAEAQWRAWGDPRSRFWLAILLRRRGSAEGDSILRAEYAGKPGHHYYAVAARETLGVRGWRGQVAGPPGEAADSWFADAVGRIAGPLALPRQATALVRERDHQGRAHIPVGPAGERFVEPLSWRCIASALYAAGELAGAMQAADRAQGGIGPDSSAWAQVPWSYPPAFERELIAAAGRAGVERALLWALVRQQSQFGPRAISRRNALGLTQLSPNTAHDVARELGEELPSDSLLFEPARSLRYGAHHLKKLLERFDGVVPVALHAYTGGPDRVRSDWRRVVELGGWALYCEMAARSDAYEDLRQILAFRQAYRELAPTSGAAN